MFLFLFFRTPSDWIVAVLYMAGESHFLSKSFYLFCVMDAILFSVVKIFKEVSVLASCVGSPLSASLSMLAILDLQVFSRLK